jgi:predicted dehydrogenase
VERFNPALSALYPHVRKPLYFEIHRVGEFTARSLDIDVVLDLMIHDLDIVGWLVGSETEVTDVRAVGIPVLTERVDAANARIEFASGAVANITASRIGTEKIRKMRFFQPHDYVAVDDASNARPGVHSRILEIADVEPLRAEIEAFLHAASNVSQPPITGADGRRALALALRVLERIHEHTSNVGLQTLSARSNFYSN